MKHTIILLPCAWILAYAQPISKDKWTVQSSVPLVNIPSGLVQPDSILQVANLPAIQNLLSSLDGSGVRLGPNSVLKWIAVPLPIGSGVGSDNLPIPSDAAGIANLEPLEGALAGVNPAVTNLLGSQSAGVAVKNTKPNENVKVGSKVDGTRVTGNKPGKPIVIKTKVNGNVQGTRVTGTNQGVLRVGNSVTGKKKLTDKE